MIGNEIGILAQVAASSSCRNSREQRRLHSNFNTLHDFGILTFSGELVAQHAHELKTVLMKALASSDRLLIRLENIARHDDHCVQVLCNALRISRALRKRIFFSGNYVKNLGTVLDGTHYYGAIEFSER
ncbi:MAG: STAS domain-containing protein [Nitrospirota bacterium]